ncbi:hypothetical protein NPIL_46131 [Nephila pilipes]|uniref:Uncharacterized protein n=1 Tax=Nephila pilipes TaxID=299642 RepID=A0A8X6Q4X8_NEPPI|nr:hypothetical protein NPIL_46131 [Nephila pilipes]
MRQDVTLGAQTCLQCHRAKVSRLTGNEIGNFEPPSSWFLSVHIILVGPLPLSSIVFVFCSSRFLSLPYLFDSILQVARCTSFGRDFSRGQGQNLLHWLDFQILSTS